MLDHVLLRGIEIAQFFAAPVRQFEHPRFVRLREMPVPKCTVSIARAWPMISVKSSSSAVVSNSNRAGSYGLPSCLGSSGAFLLVLIR